MPISHKRTFATANGDEETLSSKKPRIPASKLLASKPAPVGNKEKSGTQDGQPYSSEASGDTEGVEEECGEGEGESGQPNEADEQEVEENQGESPVAFPSSRPAPTALVCHCGHPAEMKQSLYGLPHNRGEWFGTCASGSCDYWRWANGSGQQRFNDAMDAQFNMYYDAESAGGNKDPEDYSGIDPSSYGIHLDEPPKELMEASIREMWRRERREQKGRKSDTEEEDVADFQQWIEESADG